MRRARSKTYLKVEFQGRSYNAYAENTVVNRITTLLNGDVKKKLPALDFAACIWWYNTSAATEQSDTVSESSHCGILTVRMPYYFAFVSVGWLLLCL